MNARRGVRLAIAYVLALGIAGIAITSASGSASSVAPQRACTGGPSTLNGVPTAHCFAEFIPVPLSRTSGIRPAAALAPATSCPVYFTGQDQGKSPCEILRSYNIPGPTTESASQVIAIVDAYDNPAIKTELDTFDSLYGVATLPNCGSGVTQSCFQKLNQSGGTTPPSPAPVDDDWKPEISLDVESAHAVCPNCKILLVEANNDSFANLAAAVKTAVAKGATVISNSYGLNEPQTTQAVYNTYAPTYDNGVPTFVSAGDDGADVGAGGGPAFPADVPAVTSVGGTTLTTDASGGRSSESAWADSGSGCSAFASAEPWQGTASGWDATGCGTMRGISDVSSVADPNTGLIIYTEGGWYQYGGTSLSSPLIAAMYALAANGTVDATPGAAAYRNPSDFNDITSGSNGTCGTTACNAGTGYDGPTGIGTPNGVAGFAPVESAPTITSFTPTKGTEGSSVKVTGTSLADVSDVALNGTSATPSNLTATSLTFTVPADATSGQISATNPAGTGTSVGTFSIVPTIASVAPFAPSSGIVGSTFTVTGTGFNGVTAAKIGAKPAPVTPTSDTSATVTVPTGAVTGRVALTGPGGTATSTSTFTVIPPPTISSLAPARAVEGASVKVTGAHLTGATEVTLGGDDVTSSVVNNTATSLTFTVPAPATSGHVVVTTPTGVATSVATFGVTPKIASVAPFAPSSGIVGSTFTVTGTGFNGVTAAKIGAKPAPVTPTSDTSATVTVPTGAVTGRVALTGPGGTATSTSTFTVTHADRVLSSAYVAYAATTRLAIDVWPGGRHVAAGHKHYTLSCAPARGTVPHAVRACTALAALSKPFARPAPGTACPALALGPQEAHVVGSVRGVKVDAWLNLRGCGISRWDRVKAIVPEPRHALTPQ